MNNGKLIMEALLNIETPATVKDVASYISEQHMLDENEIRGTVKAALTTGLNFGYIQKKGNKFLIDRAATMTEQMSATPNKRMRRSRSKATVEGKMSATPKRRATRSRSKATAASEGEGQHPTKKRSTKRRRSRSKSNASSSRKTNRGAQKSRSRSRSKTPSKK